VIEAFDAGDLDGLGEICAAALAARIGLEGAARGTGLAQLGLIPMTGIGRAVFCW
jgi:hypothetical protein